MTTQPENRTGPDKSPNKSPGKRPDKAEQPTTTKANPPDPESVDDVEWNPTGLDLARSVAGAIANSPVVRRKFRRHPTGTRRVSSADAAISGARPDDRDPQLLDSTIGRLVADRGWKTDVAVAGAMARWDQIVGADIGAHCRAESYLDAELTVRADSTAWATQVRMLAPKILKRLNEELGDGTVTRIVVTGPAAPSWRKGPLSVRGGRGPRDTYG